MDQETLAAVAEMLQAQNQVIGQMMKDVEMRLNMKLENQIEPQIKLLAEGHQTILEALAPKSRVEDLEDEVKVLKLAIRQITLELQELKKAQ
ncbi:MAG: hypothetical protein Q4E65_08625 [Clostridia bacterium]|nr:hypothetical protein [Clostridia bacterium]